ncbi:MAG: type II toxin-antitoxin system RelE/ParE family toxin [Chromatiaceae bacterium]|nr:type II toxin-antitoxin system RelE/ParE family toxin [Chromatiaceae bacterium]
MRIFKNAWFERFARKQKISDTALRAAVDRAEQGLIDADLGAGVIKQRVARPGQGRSGGYRTLILFRQSHRAFFVYGFAKSEQANISAEEEAAFKKAAHYVLDLTDEQIAALIRNGQFCELDNHG